MTAGQVPSGGPGGASPPDGFTEVDLATTSLRDLNQALHDPGVSGSWRITPARTIRVPS